MEKVSRQSLVLRIKLRPLNKGKEKELLSCCSCFSGLLEKLLDTYRPVLESYPSNDGSSKKFFPSYDKRFQAELRSYTHFDRGVIREAHKKVISTLNSYLSWKRRIANKRNYILSQLAAEENTALKKKSRRWLLERRLQKLSDPKYPSFSLEHPMIFISCDRYKIVKHPTRSGNTTYLLMLTVHDLKHKVGKRGRGVAEFILPLATHQRQSNPSGELSTKGFSTYPSKYLEEHIENIHNGKARQERLELHKIDDTWFAYITLSYEVPAFFYEDATVVGLSFDEDHSFITSEGDKLKHPSLRKKSLPLEERKFNINVLRVRYSRLRRCLMQKGRRSRIKTHRERDRINWILHNETRHLINLLDPGDVLVLRDMKGLRESLFRQDHREASRFKNLLVSTWVYHKAQQLLQYKARLKGIRVIKFFLDYPIPCPNCGKTSEDSIQLGLRRFVCKFCSFWNSLGYVEAITLKRKAQEILGLKPKDDVLKSRKKSPSGRDLNLGE